MSDRLYNDVTLFAVVGNKNYLLNTVKAILFSKKMCKFKHIKLLSCINIEIPDVEVIKISPMSYSDYNNFMIKSYNDYIDTPYALNIHDDGFIINPSSWTDEFLKYDYIGALWPVGKHMPIVHNYNRCGNGGFSLRSKKFLEVCQNYCPATGYAEDTAMCRIYRDILASHGILFPPDDLAAKFSIEDDTIPEAKGQSQKNYVTLKSFGFHYKSSHACKLLDLIQFKLVK